MNFFRRNLGALTPISTISSGGAAPSVAPTVQSGDVMPDPSKFTCTSDSKLVYYNGAWRVRSLDSEPCDAIIASEDTKYVMAQKEPIYVGPFKIDLTNTDGQITNITVPNQIGKDWAAWLAQALASITLARIAAKQKTDPTFEGIAPFYVKKIQMLSLLPHVIGATQDFYDNGTPMGAPVTSDPICADPELAYYNDASKPGGFCPGPRPVPPTVAKLASGGHALYPQSAQFGTDDHGFRITNVQYPDDPNVYGYYSHEQWVQALSPDFLKNGIGWLVPGDYLTPANTTQFNRNQNVPPVARFKHPITGGDWGLWITITSIKSVTIDGSWDTSIDAPDSAIMQVAMGPMPQEGWWDDFIDALQWIPISIGEALWDVGQWLGGFVCDLAGQSALLKKVPPNPYAQAAAIAALEIANHTQCGKPPIDCKDPAAAALPQCIVTVSAVIPWWQRWYVIVPALGAVGYGIFKMLGKNKPRSQPAT